MGTSTSRDRRDALRADMEPLASESPDLHEALPEGPNPDFRPHQCWRMLFVYPDKYLPEEPGTAVCQGCERTWRLDEEYRK